MRRLAGFSGKKVCYLYDVIIIKHERNRLMRTKSPQVFYFDFSVESSIKVAKEYRAKYQAISQILDANRPVDTQSSPASATESFYG